MRSHIRNGWIGRQLVGHFTRIDVKPTEVRPTTLVLLPLPVAIDILRLVDVADGTAEWFTDLQQRDRSGSFFASVTAFTVKGRVT